MNEERTRKCLRQVDNMVIKMNYKYGISCLLTINNLDKRRYIWIGYYVKTINNVVKSGYLWIGCPDYKKQITWFKGDIDGWNFLFTNNKSRG